MQTQTQTQSATPWQCVIFTNRNPFALQGDVNAWLLEYKHYHIQQVLQSESQSYTTITIFYTLNHD